MYLKGQNVSPRREMQEAKSKSNTGKPGSRDQFAASTSDTGLKADGRCQTSKPFHSK